VEEVVAVAAAEVVVGPYSAVFYVDNVVGY
jgi:hypothetical protein